MEERNFLYSKSVNFFLYGKFSGKSDLQPVGGRPLKEYKFTFSLISSVY